MDNLTAGNPRAHRVRVYYEGSSTIREGSPFSYNYDTTTNWFGGSVSNGEITESTTTAEGSQNEGKYIRVEDVTADNAEFFAGVAARGGWVGKAGPRVIEIYVPNGAIVPIWTDKSVAIKDPLYLEHGELTLVNATQVGMGHRVGVCVETIDRSSVAGIALCKLDGVSPAQSTVLNGTLGVGLSEDLWEDCPYSEIEKNPGLGIVYFDDFMSSNNLTTAEGWVLTTVTSGTLALAAAEGGAIVVSSNGHNAADDGAQAQLTNCRVLPVAGKTIWFEARCKMNDATDQYFVGLAATDTSLIAGGVLDDASDKCGFFHAVSETDDFISSITARTTADDATSDVAANADGTYVTLGFKITGITTVDFYVNGVLVEEGAVTANVPNAAMCLSLASQVEATGANAELTVDWVRIAQLGARA